MLGGHRWVGLRGGPSKADSGSMNEVEKFKIRNSNSTREKGEKFKTLTSRRVARVCGRSGFLKGRWNALLVGTPSILKCL